MSGRPLRPVRLAVWSGPRNLSTALMRAWENRPDTEVLDEPLYAHYLAATGYDHPARDEILAAGPVDGAEAVGRCAGGADAAIVYQKHMSHHLLPELGRDWLDDLQHVLLIRHPVEVLASYTKVRLPETVDEIGLPQQLELLDRAGAVIDAADFLRQPESYLRHLCRLIDVEFSDRMLAWPAGPRPSDGVWAPHWYRAVRDSTGFAPPPRPVDHQALATALGPAHGPLIAEATALYRELADHRLVL